MSHTVLDTPPPPRALTPARREPDDPLAGLTASDRRLFWQLGVGPSAPLPHRCVHHAFEEQAAAQPYAIAAQHLEDAISYGQLERQANRLAALLEAHGVRPGDSVGLFLHRSIPMLVGMLGALKAGAAYVPQHAGVAPPALLRHVVQVASIRVILTLSTVRDAVPVPDGCVAIELDSFLAEPAARDRDVPRFAPARPISPDQACFVLFTSGTTGVPNGVQVTHRNVCNILHTSPGDLGIRPGMRVSQLLSIAFDMSAWEVLGCLSHGATLIIRGESIQEAASVADVIIATPSVLASIDADRCRGAKVVAVAGEPCPRPLADTWSAFCTFYNSCGPTETTIVNTMQRYRPWEPLTIGRPTPNNTVYVLDDALRPLPVGQIGEMWAGGLCVTAGYLANDELNRERYRPDPFLGRGMMFRTRDLGRWNDLGELEHHGRTDDQVKVRGFRVELDSVSRVIESIADCTHAVTLKLDDRNLVSFVCPTVLDPVEVQAAVAAALPYYCVPALVVGLERLPMTSRGKVDKRALLDLLAATGAGR